VIPRLIVVGIIGALARRQHRFLDLFAIPFGTPASRTALVHMTLNLIVTVGYAAGFAWRYGSYHHPGPVAAGPPSFGGPPDQARMHWLTHPALDAAELRLAPDLVATRRFPANQD